MRLRLLIVDDNAQFLEVARDLLERQGAEVVAVASTGAEASRLAQDLQPDCVLLDIELGAERGFDVATGLVNDHHQRVVLMSIYREADFMELIEESAALGFISKSELSLRRIIDVLDNDSRGSPS
jgi:DNA-binding NarL/FixJ family response regulator